jgi:hypothetical protein
MKKYSIIYFFLLISIGSFMSCKDALNTTSVSTLTDDVIFSNTDLTEGAISAIYNIIGQNNSYRNRLWLQMGTNTDIEYRSGWSSTADSLITPTSTDDAFALYDTYSTMSLSNGDYNDDGNSNPWSRVYQGIEAANLAIAGIRQYGSPAAGNLMGHYLGEALTMRAFFYYDLIKWWGDVPARFTPVSSATIYLGKTNRDSIYNQIIGDLQTAIPLLYPPGTTYTATTKLVCRDAARGLLARICLSAAGYSMRPLGTSDAQIIITASAARQKELYTIARQACSDIINEGVYSLASSFQQIFYDQCQDVETQGRETIWQLPYSIGLRGRMVYNLGLPRVPDGVFNTVTIGGEFRVMPSFYYDYNVNDTRRDVTVVPYKMTKNTTTGYMQQDLGSGITGFNIAKWRAEWVKVPITGTDDGVSPILLRYADVLLMFAEADLFLGGTQGATYFNMVRRRAFGQAINSTSAYDLPLTLANIQQERAFEFCGENIRKWDLIRWGMLKSGIDQAKANLTALANSTGNYANVPTTIYYKYTLDATTHPAVPTEILTIYGLQPGETAVKTTTDPTGGWTAKTWVNTTNLSTGFINGMYLNNPDKKQLFPIFHQIILDSNGLLSNNYGYSN